jgi:hypothetical protein
LVGKSTKRVTIYIHEEKRTDLPIINHPQTTTKGGIMKNASCRQKVRSSIMVALLAAFVAAAPTGASAVDKLIVQDSTGTINKFVVTDTGSVNGINIVSGKIGIGTATPGSGITIDTNDQFVAQFINHYVGDTSAASAGMLFLRNTTTGMPLKDNRLGYILMGGIGTDGLNKNSTGIVGYAESDWAAPLYPAYFAFETTQYGARAEKMRITGDGKVGIGTKSPTSSLQVVGIPIYANNAAAIAGNLTAGAFYRTGADPDVLCVVH